jgi:hypothetical protein
MRLPSHLLVVLAASCAAAPPPPASSSAATVLLAHDDGRVDGALSFPSLRHESLIRFELPPGEHQLRRLWLQPTAPGTVRFAFYDQTPLEAPGQLLHEGTIVIPMPAVSSGKDGRWLYQDLANLPAQKGVLWLGLKRTEGEPAIAASRIDTGQYFLRSDDPANPVELRPVRRTPLVRLEVSP